LEANEQLFHDQYLISQNNCFNATFATNGNFQVKHIPTGDVLWETGIPLTVWDSNATSLG
jgi:hypothetical protein